MRRWQLAFMMLAMIIMLVTGCGGEEQTGPLVLTSASEGYTATLTIDPGIVGTNTFAVTLKDKANQPVKAGEMNLHFAMQGMKYHGKSELPLPLTEDTWSGESPNLMMKGTWQLQLNWVDEQGKSHPFTFEAQVDD